MEETPISFCPRNKGSTGAARMVRLAASLELHGGITGGGS